MLIDSKNVYSDSQASTATADSTNKVNVMSYLGRNQVGDAFITVKATAAFNNLTSLTIDLQTSDTENGTYASIQSVTVPLANLTKGAKVTAFRVVPVAFVKPWSKIVYTVTGTAPTTGAVFAALTREEDGLRYAAGLYIGKGIVKG